MIWSDVRGEAASGGDAVFVITAGATSVFTNDLVVHNGSQHQEAIQKLKEPRAELVSRRTSGHISSPRGASIEKP